MKLTPEEIAGSWDHVDWDESVDDFAERVGGAFVNPEGVLWMTAANRGFYSRPHDDLVRDAIRSQHLFGFGVELDADTSGAADPDWWTDPETKVCRFVLSALFGVDWPASREAFPLFVDAQPAPEPSTTAGVPACEPTAPHYTQRPTDLLHNLWLLSDGKGGSPAFVTVEEARARHRKPGRKLAHVNREPKLAGALIREYALGASPGTVDLLSPDEQQALDAGLEIHRAARENRICPVCDGEVAWDTAGKEWRCNKKECHRKAKGNLRHLRSFTFADGQVTAKFQPEGPDYTHCMNYKFHGAEVAGCGSSAFKVQTWYDDPCSPPDGKRTPACDDCKPEKQSCGHNDSCSSHLPCGHSRKSEGHKGLVCPNVDCARPVICIVCAHPVEVGRTGKLNCPACSRAFNSDNRKVNEKERCLSCNGDKIRKFKHSGALGGISLCLECGTNTYSDRRVQKSQPAPNTAADRYAEMVEVGITFSRLVRENLHGARAAVLRHAWRLSYAEIAKIAERNNWPAHFWDRKKVARAIRDFDAAFEAAIWAKLPGSQGADHN